jgi:hypothetical protein
VIIRLDLRLARRAFPQHMDVLGKEQIIASSICRRLYDTRQNESFAIVVPAEIS